jgi:uncharacterized protein (TIGR02145 family)
LVHTETINSETQDLSVAITTGLEGSFPLTGTVVTCQGQPVEGGYVRMGNQVYFTTNGDFAIQTCFTGTYSIRGFDISNSDSVKVSDLISVVVGTTGGDAGIIYTCSSLFDTLSDIEGHVYPIFLIGDQWWMAENLRSSTYANGDTIPHVTDVSIWDQLSTPAWCNYDNQAVNDSIYGKLYTWYAVSDPRNVCPTGWHIPTDAEWTVLEDFLGGQSFAGGKMKSIIDWNAPNTGATNESGFSGLPGGFRSMYGFFNTQGTGAIGNWWSSNLYNSTEARYRYLNASYNSFYDYWLDKSYGVSIRCVKD